MDQDKARTELAHIRSLMERSTRFLSLSGLSGVFAGAVALVGAWVAQHHVALFISDRADVLTYGAERGGVPPEDLMRTLLLDAVSVLAIALLGAFWFTWRRSERMGQGLWDASARRLAWNLLVPLITGGGACLALMHHGLLGLVAPFTLVFYGLALLNASKYTLEEVRWLALSELVLGVLSCFWVGAGLLFWALGFGVLHILYGGLMWMRHERGDTNA